MQIDIDPLSEVPIYQQLRDRVVEAIAGGELEPGEALASVRRLAVAFGINVATVGKGYDLLRQEGLIRTNHKSGSVVARGPATGPADDSFLRSWEPRLTTLLAEAVAQGATEEQILTRVRERLSEFGVRPAAPEDHREETP
ncbi:MAG TPA: GntR family transcriptional regulator [Lacisediminihabitans sp.]|uniref:GntR family transcriptional regulator n=1 Tax=Lacisediminihabitans sp. TaxID=2787631 RepID=UPI002EDB355F